MFHLITLIFLLQAMMSAVMGQHNETCNGHRHICFLPKETGPCKGAFTRFFYDKQTKSCEKFSYGGCGGNENNFKTEEECASKCERPKP